MKKIYLIIISFIICLFSSSCKNKGTVCFTFDDFGGDNWLKANEIFKKYNAHATFFISGEITEKHIEVMKKLQQSGHTIGLHSINHRNVLPYNDDSAPEKYFNSEIKPQLDICRKNNIAVHAFAYPNNLHDETFDNFLFRHFDYLRTGNGAENKTFFIKTDNIRKKMILPGTGIGKYYKSDTDTLKKLLEKATDTDTLIVFFSHNIFPDAHGVHMPSELLEELLAHAAKLNMRIIGAKELNDFNISE